MSNILVLHGPNLNLLGKREPEYYGQVSLEQININLTDLAQKNQFSLVIKQSNKEYELLEHIHTAIDNNIQYIIFNPAAFTHTSIALRDALLAIRLPFVEVHLSNIYARESFRQHSYFSDIAEGVISGLGEHSYYAALQFAMIQLT